MAALLFHPVHCAVSYKDATSILDNNIKNDEAFEVLLVFPVLIGADGGNQFAINLLSCQTLNIIKQSVI